MGLVSLVGLRRDGYVVAAYRRAIHIGSVGTGDVAGGGALVHASSDRSAVILLVGLVWPMRYVLEPAWQGRQAWSAFAADLRWVNVLRQFPILVVGVPGALAAAVHWLAQGVGRGQSAAGRGQ